jgi:hypothetical protein
MAPKIAMNEQYSQAFSDLSYRTVDFARSAKAVKQKTPGAVWQPGVISSGKISRTVMANSIA